MESGAHRRRRQARVVIAPGHFDVRARVERFVEPALLFELRAGSSHGYELADRLSDNAGLEVDYGNLYRLLRHLEAEGFVSSAWDEDSPGPAKRTYQLTGSGRALLDAWANALRHTHSRISAFLDRYDERST
jgi:poly-beta-hydroxybutyrate-responsive repressor